MRRAARAVPLSGRGALVAAASAAALRLYGYASLDLVAFVLGFAGLALVALCAACTGGAALYWRRHVAEARPDGPLRADAGLPLRTGLRVPALRRLPLVQIAWRWIEPPGVACEVRRVGDACVEEIRPWTRCDVVAVRRRFEVSDVFGLARVTWERAAAGALLVLPDRGRLRQMPRVHSLAGGEGIPDPAGAPEGDRMEIRRYVPGDSMRHVLWKVFARARQLNVRLPERSVERSPRTVAYLVAGPDDEPAAAAARVALECEALGGEWILGADGTEEPADRLEPALRAIARSGSPALRAAPTALPFFLRRMASEGHRHCVVFAPAREGAWLEQIGPAARAFAGRLHFVLGLDGIAPERAAAPAWQRLLFLGDPVPGVPQPELLRVLRTLHGVGCTASLVDRSSGRSWKGASLGALGSAA